MIHPGSLLSRNPPQLNFTPPEKKIFPLRSLFHASSLAFWRFRGTDKARTRRSINSMGILKASSRLLCTDSHWMPTVRRGAPRLSIETLREYDAFGYRTTSWPDGEYRRIPWSITPIERSIVSGCWKCCFTLTWFYSSMLFRYLFPTSFVNLLREQVYSQTFNSFSFRMYTRGLPVTGFKSDIEIKIWYLTYSSVPLLVINWIPQQ